jgi:methylated-DNA-[protein]-cysteine S-methyltransferase
MGVVIMVEWASLDTPVGPVSVGCGDEGIAQVRFGRPPAASGARADAAARDRRQALADSARAQLTEFFCGQRREFDLPLDWSGFGVQQRHVLGLLHSGVGYGETVTYGTLAGLAGLPASADVIPARAVGTIMGSNPIPVIVPCHRVVASDGLGGYSGGAGPEVKRWLLILEGSHPPTLDWVPAR